MSNKKIVEENLEELSTRICLLVKQYNLLAESKDDERRLLLVKALYEEVSSSINAIMPIDIYDLTSEYNDKNGWSSSESCW